MYCKLGFEILGWSLSRRNCWSWNTK